MRAARSDDQHNVSVRIIHHRGIRPRGLNRCEATVVARRRELSPAGIDGRVVADVELHHLLVAARRAGPVRVVAGREVLSEHETDAARHPQNRYRTIRVRLRNVEAQLPIEGDRCRQIPNLEYEHAELDVHGSTVARKIRSHQRLASSIRSRCDLNGLSLDGRHLGVEEQVGTDPGGGQVPPEFQADDSVQPGPGQERQQQDLV